MNTTATRNVEEFLSFLDTENTQIIERGSIYIVIKHFDMVCAYTPKEWDDSGTSEIYEYAEFIKNNTKAIMYFKENYIEHFIVERQKFVEAKLVEIQKLIIPR